MAEPAMLPLCVDCDGTLIRSDLLHESVLLLLKSSWREVLKLPVWLLRGKAALKQEIAQRTHLDVSRLPYDQEVIDLITRARAEGRTTVLVTASPRCQAERVAAHLGLFDSVEATEGGLNLSGPNKAARLVQRFGQGGFIYAGNSRTDLPVWAASAGAVVVTGSSSLQRAAAAVAPVVQHIRPAAATLKTHARAMRLHQWLKNLLVFVPLLAAHQLSVGAQTWAALLCFLAFGTCASAVYLINDLLDLPADRAHARKCRRPFASGALPIARGVAMVPALLLASALLATQLPLAFGVTLAGYFSLTCLYSFWLKHHVIVDVMVLTSLYTTRIIAGAAATAIVPSFWLLAFSMFMFLSLAIVKRYSEMIATLAQHQVKAAGRGYMVSDLPVLLSLGTGAGYIAILVMALYVNSPDLGGLYPNHWVLWLALPPLLYWISRVWMKAHRGEMHDDPVVFAATDRQSWATTALVGFALWGATLE